MPETHTGVASKQLAAQFKGESPMSLMTNRICKQFGLIALSVVFSGMVTLLIPGYSALAQTGREIMEKVNDREDGDNQVSTMEMILIDKNKNKRVRSVKSHNKDKGEDSLSLMFFLSPSDVKGTGFLTYDYDAAGKDDDQWLYLPALRKTKRIASSDKSGSFMGTDFNFSDLTSPDLDDFNYKLMKEVEVDGKKTWQIQAVPKSQEIMEETGYSKSVMWVRQDNHVVIRAVRWVHKSRRMKYFQVSKLEQIDGIWVALQLSMTTKEGKSTVHSTVLNISDVRFNQDLSEDLFTVRQLEKGL